jgi:hypothetical protein
VLGEVEDDGSSWDGNLGASARDSSGLFLVLKFASACGVVLGAASSRVVWFCKEYSAAGGPSAVPPGASGSALADPEVTERAGAALRRSRNPASITGGSAKERPDDR